ncbi:acyl-CoA thioesterase-2 [Actinocorallia herbida]|uniref:Acyl-CoA thioesterase-2 n=1 Tax=Actinocorallia herbida TaxID=58109 RepID=A0A3N1CYX1_9ACTN|nr:acyl-CoA thioesterase domain-containing protein [Actinocorallia herbida]ROO86470.1 acyl-CoA thioesterase-2 [Actinocorallia herbida]
MGGIDGRAATHETAPINGVLEALDLAETGPDTYTAPAFHGIDAPRSYGGQLLAQALVAAARTVASAIPAHSLHAYFLRGGDPRKDTAFAVRRLRDGRRLSSRSVEISQDERVLATMTVSFAVPSEGLDHQAAAPDVAPPDDLPTLVEWSGGHGADPEHLWDMPTVDTRVAPDTPPHGSTAWHRMAGAAPDDPALHQALLVYLSDVTTLAGALVPHGMPLGVEERDGEVWDAVSLDHAVWFYRPVRADDWLLFVQDSPVAADGRSLVRADVFGADGRLAASLAQEGLFFRRG